MEGRSAIVIPAHNEEATLSACLECACDAAQAVATGDGAPAVVVILDRCVDQSATIASHFPVFAIQSDAGSVGAARAIGARAAMTLGCTWLAFTDADTLVAPDWLITQRSLGADAVCGTVTISDWHLHDPQVRQAYETHYVDADGHRHIHGANLGISALAYTACGGFESVALHEDVDLVQRLIKRGFKVAWSARPRVSTSARTTNKVSGGFGGLMRDIVCSIEARNAADQALSA